MGTGIVSSLSGSAAAMAGDLIGGDVGDGLAVNLEGSGAVKFHADVMTCQHVHHLVMADMRSFENGGKHCQGFQLTLAVHYHGGYGSVRVQPSLCWSGHHAAAIVAAIHGGARHIW